MAQRGQEGQEVWWGWWWWWQRKVGLVGRSRETRVGSGRDAEQAYLSDGGKCRGPSVERGEEARVRERGKRECERRYTSTPRLFSLLLFPFPSSSSLSSLLSIWVRPVHSPACHVRHAMAKLCTSCHVSFGLGAKLISIFYIGQAQWMRLGESFQPVYYTPLAPVMCELPTILGHITVTAGTASLSCLHVTQNRKSTSC